MALKDKVAFLIGSVTCNYCLNSVPKFTFYDSQFDFADSDEFIRRIASERANFQFDEELMRWRYKGVVVRLTCDEGEE